MGNDYRYVHEKLSDAISTLCGEGPFIDRLKDATQSILMRLEEDDISSGELVEDFRFIMKWSKNNMRDGKILKEPDKIERINLIDKMIYVFSATGMED